jgi:uroporphyrinogen III methyltransferase/synthase
MSGDAEPLPLAGITVAVTRTAEQGGQLEAMLEALGATCESHPLIHVQPAIGRLTEILGREAAWEWILFTSANGVRAFFAALPRARSTKAVARSKIGAVGPATAGVVAENGRAVDLLPGTHTAEALAAAMAERADAPGARILWPRGDRSNDRFDVLRTLGATIDDVVSYRTAPDEDGARSLAERVSAGEIDVVAFASPSAVRSFAAVAGSTTGSAKVAVIGPVTEAAATEAGFQVAIRAAEHTMQGFARAICAHLRGE